MSELHFELRKKPVMHMQCINNWFKKRNYVFRRCSCLTIANAICKNKQLCSAAKQLFTETSQHFANFVSVGAAASSVNISFARETYTRRSGGSGSVLMRRSKWRTPMQRRISMRESCWRVNGPLKNSLPRRATIGHSSVVLSSFPSEQKSHWMSRCES